MVMSTRDFAEGSSSISVDPSANTWQKALLRRAVAAGILDKATSFGPNALATRGQVFEWAASVHKYVPSSDVISGEVVVESTGTYKLYSASESFGASDDVILFFHASWCPSCQSVDVDITSGSVPSGVHVRKVDYDSSLDLREKYNVTRQHTFIHVDQNGNEKKRALG